VFVFQVPCWNTERYIASTLRSILSQHYSEPYRLIVVDDNSQDFTWEIVREIQRRARKNRPEIQFDIWHNRENHGQLANTVKIASECDSNDVIIHVDHDDRLATSSVLARLEKEYSDPSTWMTYGSYDIDFNSRSRAVGWPCRGISEKIPEDKHDRKSYHFVASHLKTYKRWLFSKVDDDDLRNDEGQYYTKATELAWSFPMIEMCGPQRAHFIEDVLYLYNDRNVTSMSRLSVDNSENWHDDAIERARVEIDEILSGDVYALL
jgi:glycosyltransferase involved in cell wall biosynthesis